MWPAIADRPADLTEETVARPELRLHEFGPLATYYTPFDWVNLDARVTLIGITPGRHQMFLACQEARQGLLAGLNHSEILRRADRVASFAGTMRTNLITMLDEIGLANSLGLDSCGSLFEKHENLVESTSAIPYMVLVNGRNYGGSNPRMEDTPILWAFVEHVLGANLGMTPQSLVIPLGKAVARAVSRLVLMGKVDGRRCLLDFPHPSGSNGHRGRLFKEHRERLKKTVREWFGSRI